MDPLGVCIWTLVIVSFLLFFIRVVSIFYRNITLARELKRASRSAAARQCNSTTPSNVVELSNQPPKDDLPPAYDDVMQTYVNAKLALQAAEEGRVASNAANMTNASSTVTIDTCIDVSTLDLSTTRSHETTQITTEVHNSMDSSAPPPTYECSMSTDNNSGHTNTTNDIS